MDRIECSREDLFKAGNYFALMQMMAMNMLEEDPFLDKLVIDMMDKLFYLLSEKQQELVSVMVEEQENCIDKGIVNSIKRNGYEFKFEA